MSVLIRAPFRSAVSIFISLVAVLLAGCQAGSGDISDVANGTTKHIQAAAVPTRGTLSGHIYTDTGIPLQGLALINGNVQFTGPDGAFNLEFPLDTSGQATMFFFADGFPPTSVAFTSSQQLVSPYLLTVKSGGTYPKAIVTYSKMTVDLAANRATISGTVQDTSGGPVGALVLANGVYMFSGAPAGQFDLNVPLDSNKQVSHMVFASGFQPFKNDLDAYAPPPAVGSF